MALSGGSGSKPMFNSSGEVISAPVPSIMVDRRQSLTLREAFAQGVGKAHRAVVFCHYDMRNFDRSYLGETGKVG